MKRLTLVLAVGFLLLSISCGGGGTTLPPADRDLSGLEGVWTVTHEYIGTFIMPNGRSTNEYAFCGTWEITRNGIHDRGGGDFDWSYDGNILIVYMSITETGDDPPCGQSTNKSTINLEIPITPDATTANSNGTIKTEVVTAGCGSGTGTQTVLGYMNKD